MYRSSVCIKMDVNSGSNSNIYRQAMIANLVKAQQSQQAQEATKVIKAQQAYQSTKQEPAQEQDLTLIRSSASQRFELLTKFHCSLHSIGFGSLY